MQTNTAEKQHKSYQRERDKIPNYVIFIDRAPVYGSAVWDQTRQLFGIDNSHVR